MGVVLAAIVLTLTTQQPRVQTGFTDREGHYSVRVPPGRYYVLPVPVERSMQSNQVDPAALDALVKDATSVVVSPDEIRVLDLRLPTGGGY